MLIRPSHDRMLQVDVVNPERVLGNAVGKALRKQLAVDAVAAPSNKTKQSLLGDARQRWENASRSGGLRDMAVNQLADTIAAVEVGGHIKAV